MQLLNNQTWNFSDISKALEPLTDSPYREVAIALKYYLEIYMEELVNSDRSKTYGIIIESLIEIINNKDGEKVVFPKSFAEIEL